MRRRGEKEKTFLALHHKRHNRSQLELKKNKPYFGLDTKTKAGKKENQNLDPARWQRQRFPY